MNTRVGLGLMFGLLCGAGGFIFGWMFSKKKYEMLADVEVASVKKSLAEYYEKPIISSTKDIKKDSNIQDDVNKDMKGYVDYANKYRTNPVKPVSAPSYKIIEEREDKDHKSPYVISPQEFQESSYDTQTLFYHTDRILADDDFNIIHDIPGTIGADALISFGQYEDDAVYVRNDILQIDYEILKDERCYEKIAPGYRTNKVLVDNPEKE